MVRCSWVIEIGALFAALCAAVEALGDRIPPKVYAYGFLKH